MFFENKRNKNKTEASGNIKNNLHPKKKLFLWAECFSRFVFKKQAPNANVQKDFKRNCEKIGSLNFPFHSAVSRSKMCFFIPLTTMKQFSPFFNFVYFHIFFHFVYFIILSISLFFHFVYFIIFSFYLFHYFLILKFKRISV